MRTRPAGWASTARRNIDLVRTRWILFAAVALAFLVGALTLDQLYPKSYTSAAELVLEPGAVQIPPFENRSSLVVNAIEYMNTQVETVKSSGVLISVAQSEKLDGRVADLSSPLNDISFFVDDLLVKAHLKAPPDPRTAKLGRALELLSGRVKAASVGDSFILRISVSTRDPALSRRIASSLVKKYLAASSETTLGQLHSSEEVLKDRLATSSKKVQDAQAQVVDFDARHPTYTSSATSSGYAGGSQVTSGTTLRDPVMAQRNQLEWALTSERARYVALQAQLDSTQNQIAAIEGKVSSPYILNSPAEVTTPDGINLKLRLLIYLLLAPILGIAACYAAHYLAIYRRSVRLMLVKEA